MHVRGTELTIVIVLFALVSVIGFSASRWRAAPHDTLDEWALAGRGFRSWISWFVVGGDLYTAYTYVAVPALLFGSGAIGFYALPYIAIEYPLVFLIMIRLWSVCKTHGYVTAADFVRGRFGSPTLALAVAITGIVATMPYIALNLIGIQAMLTGHRHQRALAADHRVRGARRLHLALGAARARADRVRQGRPGLPGDHRGHHLHPDQARRLGAHLRHFNAHFKAAPPTPAPCSPAATSSVHDAGVRLGLRHLPLPAPVTGVLSTRNRAVVKRTMAWLPIYSFVLGLIALLGVVAIAAKIEPLTVSNGKPNTNTIIPACSSACSRTGSPGWPSP